MSTRLTVRKTNTGTVSAVISFCTSCIIKLNYKKIHFKEKDKVKFGQTDVCCILLLLQRAPIYPSWHPIGQTPLTWSHGSLFVQCPLQRSLQSNPKYPVGHAVFDKKTNTTLIFRHYKIYICNTSTYSCFIYKKSVVQYNFWILEKQKLI